MTKNKIGPVFLSHPKARSSLLIACDVPVHSMRFDEASLTNRSENIAPCPMEIPDASNLHETMMINCSSMGSSGYPILRYPLFN